MLWLGLAWGSPLDRAIEVTPGLVAVVVEQHGDVVFERQVAEGSHRRPRHPPEPALHDIRSAAKSITALAVGAALADGALASVDVAVWPLLGVDDEAHGGITVRDLLTMSSALECDDWAGRRSPGFEEKMYRRRRWRDFVLNLPVDDDYARDADGMGRFAYCTAGVFLLGQVVEEATGEPFDAYVRRRLFDPLGVGPVRWARSRSGEVQSGGQLEIAAIDLAKIGRMVLDGGRWAGEEVVPEAWVGEMFRPWRTLGPHSFYGYLWWADLAGAPQGPEPTWFMLGNGGNVVALFRDLDAVVVVEASRYTDAAARAKSFELVAAALASLPVSAP